MRKALAGLVSLAVLAVAAVPSAGGFAADISGGDAAATAAKKKKKCKGKKRKTRRCRRRAAGSPATPGTVPDDCTPASAPGRLAVFEGTPTEFQIRLSRNPVRCGHLIVEQQNQGEDPHDLQLEKSGGASYGFPELAPGGIARKNVYLGKGSWTLYCGLEGHRALGMERTLTVD